MAQWHKRVTINAKGVSIPARGNEMFNGLNIKRISFKQPESSALQGSHRPPDQDQPDGVPLPWEPRNSSITPAASSPALLYTLLRLKLKKASKRISEIAYTSDHK